MKVKFKTWYKEEVNPYELIDAVVRKEFVTTILKVLYENPKIKEELIKVIDYFERFYSSNPFEEDKIYLGKLKKLRKIVKEVKEVKKKGNFYLGYNEKGEIVAMHYDDLS